MINDDTIIFLTETQQKFNTTIWNSSYKTYINMRDKQSRKGGGLMIVHNNKQAYTEREQIYRKQEGILILRVGGTLKNSRNYDKINQCDDDELVYILGDCNAHVGIIGEQE